MVIPVQADALHARSPPGQSRSCRSDSPAAKRLRLILGKNLSKEPSVCPTGTPWNSRFVDLRTDSMRCRASLELEDSLLWVLFDAPAGFTDCVDKSENRGPRTTLQKKAHSFFWRNGDFLSAISSCWWMGWEIERRSAAQTLLFTSDYGVWHGLTLAKPWGGRISPLNVWGWPSWSSSSPQAKYVISDIEKATSGIKSLTLNRKMPWKRDLHEYRIHYPHSWAALTGCHSWLSSRIRWLPPSFSPLGVVAHLSWTLWGFPKSKGGPRIPESSIDWEFP